MGRIWRDENRKKMLKMDVLKTAKSDPNVSSEDGGTSTEKKDLEACSRKEGMGKSRKSGKEIK